MLLNLLRELKTFEESLRIEDPAKVKPVAYVLTPKQSVSLGQAQAVFENLPTPMGDIEQMGTNLEQHELITIRCTAYDANFAVAEEIAVAFYDAFKRGIAEQRATGQRLNDAFDHMNIQQFQSQPLSSFDGRPGWELVVEFQKFVQVVS